MKPTINNLLSQLHDTFAGDEPSPKAAELLRDMQLHMNRWNTPSPEEELIDTADALFVELETDHPQAAMLVRKIIETFANMGM